MTVAEKVAQLRDEAFERIGKASSLVLLSELKTTYLGRKGDLTAILKSLKELPVDQRKEAGAAANRVRVELEEKVKSRTNELTTIKSDATIFFDPTLPGTNRRAGVVHLFNQTIDEICTIFHGMGFEIARGPNVETDHNNFAALNFPPDHPARDMQDTFFVEDGRVLRTHTTPVQIRELEKRKPPIKAITPGLCFRNESISTRSHVAFQQVDGFLVDEGVTLADMKGAITSFCNSFFGEGLKLKFRPSYFPFTEPSAEVDISCFLCSGKGCQLCKYSGWLEILGCGMIDPNVLEMAGHDPERYTGYAFGMGVERPAMLKHRINDIRLFFANDIRFLRQFE